MAQEKEAKVKCPTCDDQGYVEKKIAGYPLVWRCYCDKGGEVPTTQTDEKGREYFIPLLPLPN